MLFNTIKTICISLLLIALIHYLYGFFKDTLTVPKIKDLVNKPAKRYDEMFDIMSNNKKIDNGIMQGQISMQGQSMQGQLSMQGQSMQGQSMQGQSMQGQSMQGQSMQGQISMQGQLSMQEELKTFLNELKKPTDNNSFSAANDISSGSYSPF